MKFLKVTCPKVKTWPKSTWLVSGRPGKSRFSRHSQCSQTPPSLFSSIICSALNAGNDEDGKGSDKLIYIGVMVNADKFHHHPAQGHYILISLIQLYNMKEYFPKYKIVDISEKLVGEVFMKYRNVLTSWKFLHVQDAHLMNTLCFMRLLPL